MSTILIKSVKIVCLFVLLLFLTAACAAPLLIAAAASAGSTAYVVSGKERSFTTKDSLALDRAYSNTRIFEAVTEVGREMGYNVSATDEETGTISIVNNSSGLRNVLEAGYKRELTITNTNGGKTLRIVIALMDMRNDVTPETASKILGEFKDKLSRKLVAKTQLGAR